LDGSGDEENLSNPPHRDRKKIPSYYLPVLNRAELGEKKKGALNLEKRGEGKNLYCYEPCVWEGGGKISQKRLKKGGNKKNAVTCLVLSRYDSGRRRKENQGQRGGRKRGSPSPAFTPENREGLIGNALEGNSEKGRGWHVTFVFTQYPSRERKPGREHCTERRGEKKSHGQFCKKGKKRKKNKGGRQSLSSSIFLLIRLEGERKNSKY